MLHRALLIALFALPACRPPATHAPPGPAARVRVDNATIDVFYSPEKYELPAHEITEWVTAAANAVADYYGDYPVKRARVLIRPVRGRGVFHGTATARGGPTVRVSLGTATTAGDLARDWKMTHEMVHLAFPVVHDRHHWIEEGLATYVEPFARAGTGAMSAEQAWSDQVGGMHNGLPRKGDKGLDHTPTWGRTYWGGALFCLVADVRIRERTENKAGLRDALRGIVAAGGSMSEYWEVTRAFKTGDDATGVPVLMELYEQWRAAPVDVDLDGMWAELGVHKEGRRVTFDNDAPKANIRRAITSTKADAL